MGLVIHFLSFQKEFKKLNNTEARMLEFYLSHGITFFCMKTPRFCHISRNVIMDVMT